MTESKKIKIKCRWCQKQYLVFPSDVKRGFRVYCSQACSAKHAVSKNKQLRGGKQKRSDSRLYGIWTSMITRCGSGIGTHNYKYYKGRGITVCDEWTGNFEKFEEWALANGYADNLSIDREKSHLGYSPENCRWATKSEQSRNARPHHDGKSKYRGVKPGRHGRWVACICSNYIRYYLGEFDTEEEAAIAYDTKAVDLHKKFAFLNFPDAQKKSTIL